MLATWRVLVWAQLGAALKHTKSEPFGSRNATYSALPNPKKDAYGLRCGKFTRQDGARLVTAIVPSSPHAEDAKGRGLEKLQRTVSSIRGVLGLEEAQIIVNFDPANAQHGPDGGSLSQGARDGYEKKISDLKDWNSRFLGGNLTIFTNSEWTNQAEMLHQVFDRMKAEGTLTPIVYVAPEDLAVDGLIDVGLILQTLSCDAEVDYVRFLRSLDCIADGGEDVPCLPHMSTPFLHSVEVFNERPHFATASFYLDIVLKNIPRSYRGLPQNIIHTAPHMWAYGSRGHMMRDASAVREVYEQVQPFQPKSYEYGLSCGKVSYEDAPKLVTALVVCSPRKEDADGRGLDVLQQTITSIKSNLRLANSRIIVAFDAVREASEEADSISQEALNNYDKKISDIQRWDPNLTIYKNEEWTHQSEMMHRVFDWLQAQRKLTPMFFVAQDDSVVSGDIDVPFILTTLSCDPEVDYVRFLWANDCSEGHAPAWNAPCEQHPMTPLLQHVGRMSDRPYFATAGFLQHRLFDRIPRSFRGGPERIVTMVPNLWIYGERNHMKHDANVLTGSFNRDAAIKHNDRAQSSPPGQARK